MLNIKNQKLEDESLIALAAYIEEIILSGSVHLENDKLFNIAKEYPVYFVNEESMPDKIGEHSLILSEKQKDEHLNKGTEYLGLFCPFGNTVNEISPAILICPERIKNSCANKDNENEYRALLAMVMIHEYAHALFHQDRKENGYLELYYEEIKNPNLQQYHNWMEESMANLLTLEYFRNFEYGIGKAFENRSYFKPNVAYSALNEAMKFMMAQPANYRLGCMLFTSGIHYQKELWPIRLAEKDESTIKAITAAIQYLQGIAFNTLPFISIRDFKIKSKIN